MHRFVIERALPEIGSAARHERRNAAAPSNGVLQATQAEGTSIHWEHSHVAADKTFCVYVADGPESIAEHADRSGFPATTVTDVGKVIDPTTANAWSRDGAFLALASIHVRGSTEWRTT